MDLGTSDLSESFIGYCTMFGDHASHYNVNASVPKTLISFLIEWAGDKVFSDEKVQSVLRRILDEPISAGLLPLKKRQSRAKNRGNNWSVRTSRLLRLLFHSFRFQAIKNRAYGSTRL